MVTLPKTSHAATCAFWLGILSWIFGPFTAIPAIVFGHIARRDIKKSEGRLTGNGMALTGLILGYVFGIGTLLMAGIILSDYLAVSSMSIHIEDQPAQSAPSTSAKH